jgi:hypothetical protein
MDRKATYTVLKTLIQTLNRDFFTNLDAEKILANCWAADKTGTADSDTEVPPANKHIVLVGASNMKKLVPLLMASGYTVTDLSLASWMATPENISEIEECINSLGLDTGFTLIMELFGNSTYRYEQFDRTRALPFKYGSCYHMEGRISVCDDESFLKLLSNANPIICRQPGIANFHPAATALCVHRVLHRKKT